jgi:hypothetical protein
MHEAMTKLPVSSNEKQSERIAIRPKHTEQKVGSSPSLLLLTRSVYESAHGSQASLEEVQAS